MRLPSFASALFLALTSLATAQSFDTPKALLEAFYKPYFDGNFYDDETPYRSERLNALYADDAENTPAGEMGAIEFHPYVDGQDYELTDFKIGEPVIDGDRATVVVSFDNFDTPTEITYDLVQEEGGWRIDDVSSDDGEYPYRLSEIFEAAKAGR